MKWEGRKRKVEHRVVVATVGVNYCQSFEIALRPTLLNFRNLIPTLVCVFLADQEGFPERPGENELFDRTRRVQLKKAIFEILDLNSI